MRAAVEARLRAAGSVFASDEADLLVSSARTPAELESMVDRRIDGVPLEHILGWAWFCGIRVCVTPGVFVPRARTELLVREAAALADAPGTIVVDLCCGSGAIGVAIAAACRGQIRLHATDIDPVSVECARRNLEPIGGYVHQGDLFTALPGDLLKRVEVVAVNAPYVPTDAMSLLPPEARLYEPRHALDGGVDGLDIMRRIVAEAPSWLAPGGHVVIETSEWQAAAATDVVARAGLIPRVVRDDDIDATVVVASV